MTAQPPVEKLILASAHLPLVERLRKQASCVIFLDGAREPAADVADGLRKAADEIERLRYERGELINGLQASLAEWDKFTRYGSPMAKAANERIAYARDVLARANANCLSSPSKEKQGTPS